MLLGGRFLQVSGEVPIYIRDVCQIDFSSGVSKYNRNLQQMALLVVDALCLLSWFHNHLIIRLISLKLMYS